ncbi:uroporphyrinogen decarboxylase [Rhizobium sp. G21]|uniref:uroporphyrinogen decarboxylase n=1 Tax=Rhizobium sp. G21 TaxID=2758439 RepID=UPI001602C152|nr:uroporphyrinogen decarboxylase [Rhizobium sp. G21]MBB1249492.1 uroporphyrinogen decarboxylase [Rhizobium sp. G21]
MEKTARKVMEVLSGKTVSPPPVWLMRQAGRYLPEYRQTRSQAKGFLDLCYTPELAVEVTMQPIRRYGFDAAILFSDILVIPDAMNRNVRFVEGEGPQLDPISLDEIERLQAPDVARRLAPVFETVSRLREGLPDATTLLGFCGAPWTIATYMIAGHGTPDQAPARLFAYKHPSAFERLLSVVAEASAEYLIRQIDAGADAVQIFDSWAGVLGDEEFEHYAVRPVRRIVDTLRAARPSAKVIAFAKGAGANLRSYRQGVDADAIGLDWTIPLDFAAELQKDGAVQGNLDPLLMVAGGDAMESRARRIVDKLGHGPLIFNLGHGITPQADPENVTRLLQVIRGG